LYDTGHGAMLVGASIRETFAGGRRDREFRPPISERASSDYCIPGEKRTYKDLSHFSMGYGDFTSLVWFDEDPI
jgi:hypothetical protein